MLYSRSTFSEFLTIEYLECKEILTQGNCLVLAMSLPQHYTDHIKIFLFISCAPEISGLYISLLPICVWVDMFQTIGNIFLYF